MNARVHKLERTTNRTIGGFSLIELLIVVAVIAILVSLVIVGFRRVQIATARTESVNALRQMITGYLGYSGDNNGRLMPGYVDYDNSSPATPLLNARLPNGEWMVNENAPAEARANLSSYVWRLTPYLANNWQTVMTDYRESGAVSSFETQYDQGKYGPAQIAKGISIASAPAYGLNSIFFGGDDRHGGTEISKFSPWGASSDDRIAATRATEVRSTRAIVFAPTGRANPQWSSTQQSYELAGGMNQPPGYPELRPPFIEFDGGVWRTRQWNVGEGAVIEPTTDTVFPKGVGIPIIRHRGQHLPVARFDGGAEAVLIEEIMLDMRAWSPFETGLQPPPIDP